MDYDVVFVDDERNAVTVKDHRTNRPSSGGWRPRPGSSGTRTVVVPPGARPTVITGGSSSSGYYRPVYQPAYGPVEPSFASRFGMSTGELIDSGLQVLAALQPLPSAPISQGDTGVDVENLMTYQGALWQHAKRDEQWRTLGGLIARILK
ncbi:MAG: hypothetical protein AB7T06_31425 [Kofleriaceae bacterium]